MTYTGSTDRRCHGITKSWVNHRMLPAWRCKYRAKLRQQAVALIQKRAASEPSLERVAELEALARQLAVVSPHKLRHGLAYRLWKTATPAAIMQILGHSRVSTTLKYGQPTDDNLRAALEEAGRVR